MNLGGNILNNAQTSSGKISSTGTSSSSLFSSSSNDIMNGGNGVLGEVVRPQFRGFKIIFLYNKKKNSGTPNIDFSEASRNGNGGGFGSAFAGLGNNGGNSGSLLGEYGGGPLGAGSKSQPRSILDTLMGSFLGNLKTF